MIGFFDSGVGGLSIWRAVVDHLPHEATAYVADSARCPYGPRPPAEIIAISREISHFLLDRHACKMLVVACNTASAAALRPLRAEFAGLPIVGLEPALKPATAATRSGQVGVLATAGTFRGALFQGTRRQYARGVTVHTRVAHGLVEQVEAGQLDSPQTAALLHQYLEPMLAAGVDQLVLGCTHYPLLMPLIERIVAGRATILDPAQAVARQVTRLLSQHGLHAAPNPAPAHHFYSSGSLASLQALLTRLGYGNNGQKIGKATVTRIKYSKFRPSPTTV